MRSGSMKKVALASLACGGAIALIIGGMHLSYWYDIRMMIERQRKEVPWIILAASCANADNMDFLWALNAYNSNVGAFSSYSWEDLRENYSEYERDAQYLFQWTRCKLKRFRISRDAPGSGYFDEKSPF